MKTKQIVLNVNTDGCSFVNTLSYFSLFLYLDSRVYSKKHVKKERSRERAELAKAWNLLDPLGKGEFHDYSTFKCTSGRSWSVIVLR